ncbi:MAG: hypothetical protein AAF541_06290 [Pseudomonadota bacterium]
MSEEFPETPWSLIAQMREGSADKKLAMQQLLENYWQPIAQSINWHHEQLGDQDSSFDLDAQVHGFLSWILRPERLADLNPESMQFRMFLKGQLPIFLELEERPSSEPQVSEFHLSESHPLPPLDPCDQLEDAFDQSWILLLFTRALDKLQQHSKQHSNELYQIFCAKDVDVQDEIDPEATLAQTYESPDRQEQNLWRARRMFRNYLIADLTDYCPDQFSTREELAWLLDL